MDLDKITQITATSKGIIEIGSATIYLEGKEYQFDIEEHLINGNHEFKVFLAFGTDTKDLVGFKVDGKTAKVLDQPLVDLIHQEYQRLSGR